MSTDDYDDTTPDSSEQGEQRDPEKIASLRAAAEKGRKLEPKVAQLERENAFLKAGINPEESKQLEWFYKGYDGELTTDAIRTAATEAGYIAPPQASPEVQQHQQGQRSVMRAASGSEAEFDPAGATYAMQQAFAEGGVEAMIAAGKQYGLPVARQQ